MSITVVHQQSYSFNTASGKCCYFITFVFPSLRSGTRDVRSSSSLHFSAASHPLSHTVNGKYCCNLIEKAVEYLQPVKCSNTVNGMAITTVKANKEMAFMLSRFNIVNGKYCCFITIVLSSLRSGTRDVRTSSSRCCLTLCGVYHKR